MDRFDFHPDEDGTEAHMAQAKDGEYVRYSEIAQATEWILNPANCGKICANSAGHCGACVEGSEFRPPWH
ncbi:hypothetical protein [Pseudodesulfovibrio sp.]|uniref:hypothetical protein n=1 Tax=Pseudodesulfovibrio sp. TaxID=2035812 RepID=UPI00261B7A91|nr:hypothetical protein [Pseudodesulfovibrio sp.]MDD3310992.1 hypothetical protein [Pseudodesulfovibrio sp.]